MPPTSRPWTSTTYPRPRTRTRCSNVLRDDVVTPSVDRDEVLAQAPDVEDEQFKVPPVLGEAP